MTLLNAIPLYPTHREELEMHMRVPQKEDIILRGIYANAAVQGYIVLAGQDTLNEHPIVENFRIHFLKQIGTVRTYDTEEEFEKTLEIAEKLPGLGPIPIGHSEYSFRSEYIEGQTIRSKCAQYGLFPTTESHVYTKCSPNHSMEFWTYAENALASILSMHDIERVHGDFHMENALIRPDKSVAIIDFESMQEPKREEDYDWDMSNLKVFAKRLLNTGIRPADSPLLSLTKGAKHADEDISSAPRAIYSIDLSI